MKELVSFLQETEVFKGLDADDVGRIADICRPARFNKGDAIVEEDARERELYIIKSGRVTISLSPPGSEEARGMLTNCTPGHVFGELSFIDGARRSTWVIALDEVVVATSDQLDAAAAEVGHHAVFNARSLGAVEANGRRHARPGSGPTLADHTVTCLDAHVAAFGERAIGMLERDPPKMEIPHRTRRRAPDLNKSRQGGCDHFGAGDLLAGKRPVA